MRVNWVLIALLSNGIMYLAHSEEQEAKSGRVNMGLYTQSITEQASISDIEISMNFWVKDALAFEARKCFNCVSR